MPRTFDYANNDAQAKAAAYLNGAPFAEFSNERFGKNEVAITAISGPHGIFFTDCERHQFTRSVDSSRVYQNASADEAFEWLSDNVRGRWNWREAASNHGHSVITNVWIEDAGDIDAFRSKFPGDFKFYESTQARNVELRLRLAALPDNGLRPGLTAMMLAHVFMSPDEETFNFLEETEAKVGGPEIIAEAICWGLGETADFPMEQQVVNHAVADYLKNKAGPEIAEKVLESTSNKSGLSYSIIRDALSVSSLAP